MEDSMKKYILVVDSTTEDEVNREMRTKDSLGNASLYIADSVYGKDDFSLQYKILVTNNHRYCKIEYLDWYGGYSTKKSILEFPDDKSALLWFKLEYGG
jgi:hypothetical protein